MCMYNRLFHIFITHVTIIQNMYVTIRLKMAIFIDAYARSLRSLYIGVI